MLDLTKYPFLAIHPTSDSTAVHITDCADAEAFGDRWTALEGAVGDDVQSEFGYDTPLFCGASENILEDFSTAEANQRMEDVTEVLPMTFVEYVDLVASTIAARDGSESDLSQLIDKFRDKNKINRSEGRRGVEMLCAVSRALGYKDPQCYGQLTRIGSIGDLILFLEDNSGAVDALVEWIGNQNVPEWTESINGELKK